MKDEKERYVTPELTEIDIAVFTASNEQAASDTGGQTPNPGAEEEE